MRSIAEVRASRQGSLKVICDTWRSKMLPDHYVWSSAVAVRCAQATASVEQEIGLEAVPTHERTWVVLVAWVAKMWDSFAKLSSKRPACLELYCKAGDLNRRR